ncbi:unnamed protein product [Linum tenue]|uniref:Uncharacterized protein n=1 Tax=Linum tenue TaxID=586396 RepID=A0AAV0NIL1_9ROSI|nr:unnamed protein product [Linum tenue]
MLRKSSEGVDWKEIDPQSRESSIPFLRDIFFYQFLPFH